MSTVRSRGISQQILPYYKTLYQIIPQDSLLDYKVFRQKFWTRVILFRIDKMQFQSYIVSTRIRKIIFLIKADVSILKDTVAVIHISERLYYMFDCCLLYLTVIKIYMPETEEAQF